MGRYLDDFIMEDEVFLEQDQLMRPGILEGRLTANQLGNDDDYQNKIIRSSYMWLPVLRQDVDCWLVCQLLNDFSKLVFMSRMKRFYSQSRKILSSANFR